MFTMLLSVIVYNHQLTFGQWLGAGVVFAGISVEAFIKRRGTLSYKLAINTDVNILLMFPTIDIHAKRVIQEKEKAKIKSI